MIDLERWLSTATRHRAWFTWQRAYTPAVIAIALLVVDILRSKGAFSAIQVLGITNDALPLALAALGETLVIFTNGIDLSIGSMVTLGNVTVAVLSRSHPDIAVIAALAVSAGAGLMNGLIICYARIGPLIATLATGSVFLGVALILLPSPGGGVPAWLAQATVGSIGSIPVSGIWLAFLAVLGWALLRRTSFGVKLQALGGNEAASFSEGVQVDRIRILAYVGAGLCSGLGGIVLDGLTQSGDPTIGTIYLLNAIAALVVGGTSLVGGVGTLVGSILGAIVLSLVSAVLFVSGLSTNLQYVVTGAIVIGALLVHSLQAKRSARVLARRRSFGTSSPKAGR